ncbi:hypothetical protein J4N45_14445 [Vibrio sp. SCSIO 43140]|nr:hypothetical protein [Vibrio sp. SCSIO 43140]USD58812.1 hypothetical protein J4N45_09740 [Vibrio sp. SCSIO 43140]USD59146.1 hypothetical protein J4N45_11445 [Vibrio sp. SCSIO 43140]USD59701.1 hypothetical protein J4N45_14445 [Vibrio sp. SCSIO 43140]
MHEFLEDYVDLDEEEIDFILAHDWELVDTSGEKADFCSTIFSFDWSK